jgi:hypothetical protein
MKSAQIKVLVWSVAVAVGALVIGYVALFFLHRNEYLRSVPTTRMGEILAQVADVPRTTENIVSVDLVERGLKRYDWTAKPPPPKVEAPVAAGPEEAPKEMVEKLISIRGIRFDAEAPLSSEVVFKYLSEAKVVPPNAAPDGSTLKLVGENLDGRLNQIQIAAIYPGAVEFAFLNETGREHEFVGPDEYEWESRYTNLHGEAPRSSQVALDAFIRPAGNQPAVALQTQLISPNRFRLGAQDIAFIDENFPEIMTKEVTIRQHKDPKTKRVDGIEVTKVAPGSIAERHGVQEGDVIKSINGHPVSSKEEAILFVKNNKDKYTEWVVEVWNKGQLRTITYYPPKK